MSSTRHILDYDPLRMLLADVHLEVIPLREVREQVEVIPVGSVVTVTASPSRGLGHTVDLATDLQAMGYQAAPHLSARMVSDRNHLEKLVAQLDEAGVRHVFVVGGDLDPKGDFQDALGLLEAMAELGHPFSEVGIAGYPEGHPLISAEHLRVALLAKVPHASYIVTQMCFDPHATVEWIRAIHSEGVDLPVRIGVPGAVDIAHLAKVAGWIGVGDSVRFLTKNRGLVRVLRPGGYRPDRLIRRLAELSLDVRVEGLHVFTFNQVASTVAWHRRALANLG
jgi:methylenetetrahydrofolate reductase (NADPH)